jgi:hypothetical protein
MRPLYSPHTRCIQQFYHSSVMLLGKHTICSVWLDPVSKRGKDLGGKEGRTPVGILEEAGV